MRTALRFRGKRPSRPSIVATAAGAFNSLLFLVDGHSAKRFLVDTGAAVSVYSASLRDINGGSHTRSLVAANGSNIATYGTRRMNIRLENQDYTWPFILADVKTPLFGADFLQANGLLVDLQSKRLVKATSFASSTLRQSNQTSLGLHHVTSDDPYSRLLEQFPTSTRPEFSSKSVRHGVEHFIQTEGPPVHARARRRPPDKLVIAKEEFRNMEDTGIIRRSVRGLLPCTWCRITSAVGDRVANTDASMTSRRPTAIRYHPSRGQDYKEKHKLNSKQISNSPC